MAPVNPPPMTATLAREVFLPPLIPSMCRIIFGCIMSTNMIDLLVYCQWIVANGALTIGPLPTKWLILTVLIQEIMAILSIATTFFLLWMLAIVLIVRWVHVVSTGSTTVDLLRAMDHASPEPASTVKPAGIPQGDCAA